MSNEEQFDFFISYTKSDERWAEWIAWQLEDEAQPPYRVFLQAWDFHAGGDFVHEMQKATTKASRTIAVLSPEFLQAKFTEAEWQAAFAKDPTGELGLLVPVRVAECKPEGLLKARIYIDLVGLEEERARAKLLESISSKRRKPASAPQFPTTSASRSEPSFPGPGAVLDPVSDGPTVPERDSRKTATTSRHAPRTSRPAAAEIDRKKEVILLVHGIRTFAGWQPMVKRVLEEIPHTKVIPIKYGYLDAFRFWFPFFTRHSAIDDLRREMQHARAANPDAQMSVIAHSFGTYAIARILTDHPDIRFHRLILSGSIIPRTYRWDHVRSRLATDVLNDYGTRDIWPVLAKSLSWGYGDTGRHGFGRIGVTDRGHDNAHSDFFTEQFVRDYWKPWFETDQVVASPWEEKAPSPSWALSVMSVLPLKWILCFLLIAWAIWLGSKGRSNGESDHGSLSGTYAGEVREFSDLEIAMLWCPPGTFKMGSPESDEDAFGDEMPQVDVTLSHGFWLGQTVVTQGQWEQLMGTTPWKGEEYVKEGADYPAVYVSHGPLADGTVEPDSAMAFCRKLTASERVAGRLPDGWEFTLPTEAQWEYACRAGTTTRYSFGDNASLLGDYAWYDSNARAIGNEYAHAVGNKLPNPWGFHDLHGNVMEWCLDLYNERLPGGRDPMVEVGSHRVIRGGGWFSSTGGARSASRNRYRFAPSSRGDYLDSPPFLGFRLALSPLGQQAERPTR